jgi:DnaJ-domain-containing protein 1
MNKNPYRQLLAEDTREVIANMSEQVELLRREMVEVDSALASLGMEEKRSNDHRKEIESQVLWSSSPSRLSSLSLSPSRSITLAMKLTPSDTRRPAS